MRIGLAIAMDEERAKSLRRAIEYGLANGHGTLIVPLAEILELLDLKEGRERLREYAHQMRDHWDSGGKGWWDALEKMAMSIDRPAPAFSLIQQSFILRTEATIAKGEALADALDAYREAFGINSDTVEGRALSKALAEWKGK